MEWKKIQLENEIDFEIKDGNGYIREYNNNKLIIEGEYLNGQRSGKGNEYDGQDHLKFRGKYLKGEEMDMDMKAILDLKVNI